MAYKKNKKRPKMYRGKKYSQKERKAYWMGVGAGEVFRENEGSVHSLPTWKVKDLGPKAVESYYAGFKKNYKGFD